jgi:hypothetical protein
VGARQLFRLPALEVIAKNVKKWTDFMGGVKVITRADIK